ncbi:unnamed protein product [Periconia digitata]|uniref:Ketohexokinase n=1 Tax=Periconia digitata TaxID=1303443 RepID=A0A9W4XX08_9PLEO|nr:unnamed protein product [Periconia digitata]
MESSSLPSTKHIICVGAVYIDTILSVPKFPIEDEKLRATHHTKRRGGNCANTLEVLSQLISAPSFQNGKKDNITTNLHLITVLPNKTSLATKFIYDTLPEISTADSIFRAAHEEAASCYILQNAQNHSRTIISHSPLEEMAVHEFVDSAERLVAEAGSGVEGWYHFEGRVPGILKQCVEFLRTAPAQREFKVSVECEKPERVGMSEVAKYADAVFYSRIWVLVSIGLKKSTRNYLVD